MKLRRPPFKKARIEIIPMIDTIFFLLVFFMMSSLTMVQMSAKKVTLPDSTTAAGNAAEKIVVSVTKDNEYYIDRRKVNFEDILPNLTERVQGDPSVAIILNCDKDQEVSQLQAVMDIAKQANPATMYIATEPKSPTEIPTR